jgi:hypothetical protein
MDSLEFHVVQERALQPLDDVVLLFHDTAETKDTGDILDPSHIHYRLITINGTVAHLDYVAMLHNNIARRNTSTDVPPPKLTITISNEYILLRNMGGGNQQPHLLAELQSSSTRLAGTSSSSSGTSSLHRAGHVNRSTVDHSRPMADDSGSNHTTQRTIERRSYAGLDELWPPGRPDSRNRQSEDDERSEDSDTRKHTKTSIIRVGLSEVEVLGKHAVHDDILRTTAVRTLMEKDRLKKFITAAGHGYF